MGGAAGHMRHPFDLISVKSGLDLINIFYDLKDLVSQDDGAGLPSVKFDGMNTSVKVTDQGNLAVDRGSIGIADVEGITSDSVFDRFPKEGHGMRTAIPTVLNILNAAGIESELRKLGMHDNHHYFLNVEFAPEGTVNATAYDGNYIFIHGLNAFYEKTYRGVSRQGFQRPLVWNPKKGTDVPTKDKSVEIPYDKQALADLVKKANKVASEMKPSFKVVGPVDAYVKNEISYDSVLASNLTIPVSEEYLQSDPSLRSLQGSTLETWLKSIKNKPAQYWAPVYDKSYKTHEGKQINPYHKNTYVSVIENGVPVDSIVEDQSVRPLIDGIVMLHATRKLGQAFLTGLTSDLGDMVNVDDAASDHEGVVIRSKEYSKYPFKITGEFIVRGMYGEISKKMETNEVKVRLTKRQINALIGSLIRF